MTDLEKVEVLRKALIDLVGSADSTELKAMELVVRNIEAPNRDKTIAINAIHAILDTQ